MGWNRVAVAGAGLIKFGELFEQSYEQMAAGAFAAAMASVDKGFEPVQVEAAMVATQRGTLWGQEGIGGKGQVLPVVQVVSPSETPAAPTAG